MMQSTESENLFQMCYYKVLSSEATDKEKAKNHWDATPALQDMSINSVIGVSKWRYYQISQALSTSARADSAHCTSWLLN